MTSRDEVGQLAMEFNALMKTVEHKTRALHATNHQLEIKHHHLVDAQAHLKQANWELKSLSEKDALTGLYNRMALERKLTREWSILRRRQAPISILLIDIDRFKEYNDQYGHQAGDDCLRQVAFVFSSITQRASDMAARYGGEEFLIILPGTERENAVQLGLQLMRKIKEEHIVHAHSEHNGWLTISIGVSSIIPEEALSVRDLIQNADEALYRAKKLGRNRLCDGSKEFS